MKDHASTARLLFPTHFDEECERLEDYWPDVATQVIPPDWTHDKLLQMAKDEASVMFEDYAERPVADALHPSETEEMCRVPPAMQGQPNLNTVMVNAVYKPLFSGSGAMVPWITGKKRIVVVPRWALWQRLAALRFMRVKRPYDLKVRLKYRSPFTSSHGIAPWWCRIDETTSTGELRSLYTVFVSLALIRLATGVPVGMMHVLERRCYNRVYVSYLPILFSLALFITMNPYHVSLKKKRKQAKGKGKNKKNGKRGGSEDPLTQLIGQRTLDIVETSDVQSIGRVVNDHKFQSAVYRPPHAKKTTCIVHQGGSVIVAGVRKKSDVPKHVQSMWRCMVPALIREEQPQETRGKKRDRE